jgi:ribonuclease HI
MDLTFYTDGSCLANGKENAVGGYGVVGVDKYNSVQFVRAKRTKGTTNNREELKAILYVMLNYGEKCDDWGQPPIVYSDSAYCVNTFNEWMFNWARNGWIKSDKKVPENLDLIQAYYDWYKQGYRIDLRKIKGHNGDEWNELADQLATGYISEEEALNTYG